MYYGQSCHSTLICFCLWLDQFFGPYQLELKSLVSIQSEWTAWYKCSVDSACNLDEVWTANISYNFPTSPEDTCTKVIRQDYTSYSLNYEKQKANVYIWKCGLCHVPMRYCASLCKECVDLFPDL